MANKDILQQGDFIVRRNNDVELVTGFGLMTREGHFNLLEDLDDSLHCVSKTHGPLPQYDVVKIYRPKSPSQACFDGYRNGELMWDENSIVINAGRFGSATPIWTTTVTPNIIWVDSTNGNPIMTWDPYSNTTTIGNDSNLGWNTTANIN